MEVKKQQSWSCPGALSRFLILPSGGGLNSKRCQAFVLHAFCCVPLPVISFSTEKAFSTGKKKKGKERGGEKKQNQPPTFLAMGCFSKQLIKR